MFITCREVIMDLDQKMKAVPVIFEFAGLNVDCNDQVIFTAKNGDLYTVVESADSVAYTIVRVRMACNNRDEILELDAYAVCNVLSGRKYESRYVKVRRDGYNEDLLDIINSSTRSVSQMIEQDAEKKADDVTKLMDLFGDI